MTESVEAGRAPLRAEAKIHLEKFLKNLDFVSQTAANAPARQQYAGMIPMIKCDAYGHGAVPLAAALAAAGKDVVLGLGVATLAEAAALRRARIRLPLIVFSDCAPFTEEVASFCMEQDVTAVLHSVSDVEHFIRFAGGDARFQRLKFHLKFNSGMNRLGIEAEAAGEVAKKLWRARLRPEGVLTHLAEAGDSASARARRQWERFRSVLPFYPAARFVHAESSDAIFLKGRSPWQAACNVVRPGIALYGYCGGATATVQSKLQPVLSFSARVLKSSRLAKGECVGYGYAFVAKKPTALNVLAVGYGDGLHRALSNKTLLIAGSSHRVLGRVSMDATAVEGAFKAGSWVQLLGADAKQGLHWAAQARTVVYEVLTSIAFHSGRVHRSYVP